METQETCGRKIGNFVCIAEPHDSNNHRVIHVNKMKYYTTDGTFMFAHPLPDSETVDVYRTSSEPLFTAAAVLSFIGMMVLLTGIITEWYGING